MMITFNTSFPNSNKQINFSQKNKTEEQIQTKKYLNSRIYSKTKNRKITLNEGIQIFCRGITGQFMDTINSIFEHPIKAIAGFLGISAGLMLLPIIGIPASVGGGTLAIGFAGIAIGKGVFHTKEFLKNNKDGSRDQARLALEKVGRDGFDLAISAPFVPKSVATLKRFSKYGKVQYNKDLMTKLCEAELPSQKFEVLKKGNKDLNYGLNFQEAIDKELAIMNDLTEAEKLQVRNELMSYCVPEDEIPNLILEKFAQEKGIPTKPDISYVSMPENNYGTAFPTKCAIYINDFKQKFNQKLYDDFIMISKKIEGNLIQGKFQHKQTGQIIEESIEKDVFEKYMEFQNKYANLSPQAQKILTTIHEREHISQYARAIMQQGYDVIKGMTPRAKELYKQMIKEMPMPILGSPEYIEAESLTSFARNNTPFNYIKRPFECAARNKEAEMLARPIFQRLNNVYLTANKTTIETLENNILWNGTRLESVNN